MLYFLPSNFIIDVLQHGEQMWNYAVLGQHDTRMLLPLDCYRVVAIVGILHPKPLKHSKARVERHVVFILRIEIVIFNIKNQTVPSDDLTHEFSYVIDDATTINGRIIRSMEGES